MAVQRAYELELARAVQARLQAEGTLSKLIAALQQQQAQQAQQHQQQQQSLQQQQLSQLHGQEQWLLQPGMHALPMGVHAARYASATSLAPVSVLSLTSSLMDLTLFLHT